MSALFFEHVDTLIGTLTLAADTDGLRHIEFPDNRHPVDREDWIPDASGAAADVLRITREQLREYFEGTRHAFDLPLRPQGTAFQMDVWRMLATIPWGATWSYRDLARAIGKPAWVIGGAQIYAQALPLADEVWVTEIAQEFDGDAHAPSLGAEWKEASREAHTSANGLPFSFVCYRRAVA